MSPGSHVLKVSLGFIKEKEISGHRECMCLTLQDTTELFSKVAVQIYFTFNGSR